MQIPTLKTQMRQGAFPNPPRAESSGLREQSLLKAGYPASSNPAPAGGFVLCSPELPAPGEDSPNLSDQPFGPIRVSAFPCFRVKSQSPIDRVNLSEPVEKRPAEPGGELSQSPIDRVNLSELKLELEYRLSPILSQSPIDRVNLSEFESAPTWPFPECLLSQSPISRVNLSEFLSENALERR